MELSKLVKRQSGGEDIQEWKAKPAAMLGENIAPFLIPSKKKSSVRTEISLRLYSDNQKTEYRLTVVFCFREFLGSLYSERWLWP